MYAQYVPEILPELMKNLLFLCIYTIYLSGREMFVELISSKLVQRVLGFFPIPLQGGLWNFSTFDQLVQNIRRNLTQI